jgi:O-antigen ligase
MNREAIDTWIERAILGLVVGALAFGVLAFGGVRPADFVVLWWLILIALGLWIARIWIAPRFRFLWPPICWAIIPFVAYAIWRWRTADIEFAAREEVTQIVLAALLFILVVNNLYGQESVRVLTFGLVFLAMFVAMYAAYQWMRSSETVWGFSRSAAYAQRASGSFICPNHLAGFLEMILPLGIALSVSGRVKAVVRICTSYASLVIVVGMAGAQSRGGWIATAAALAMLVLFMLRTKGQYWIALGLLIAVTGTGYWLYSRSVAKRVQETELSGHGREIRLRLWGSAWQMWKTQPWWGIGPDHFDYHYGRYREAIDRTQGRPGRAHNDYVNTLADYGAVGLALALLPLGFAAWGVARSWPHLQRAGNEFGERKSNRAAIVLGASAGLVALLMHSFFDFNMHIPANAFVAVTLLAIISSHWRFATERYWVTARWPVAIGATAALAAVLCGIVPRAITRTREIVLLHQAEKLRDGAPKKIALLKRAFELQPKNFHTAFAIGEQLRALAWTGGDDNQERAREALEWFQRNVALNKWDVDALTHVGMCLDWLGRHDEARPYFTKALELDPNHFSTRGMMGWHELQRDNYKEAYDWMIKSQRLNWTDNPFTPHLRQIERMLFAPSPLDRLPAK